MQLEETNKQNGQKPGSQAKESILVHLSQLLGSTILDAAGHSLGRIREVAVTPGVRASLVTELIWGRKEHCRLSRRAGLEHLPNGSLAAARRRASQAFNMGEPLLLLDRDLMDQQIIDVHGRKVVRVNDVSLLWLPHEAGGEMRALEVEVGTRGAMRRLLKGFASKRAIERTDRQNSFQSRFRGILWI